MGGGRSEGYVVRRPGEREGGRGKGRDRGREEEREKGGGKGGEKRERKERWSNYRQLQVACPVHVEC